MPRKTASERHLEYKAKVKGQEAVRVTLIHCLDMLKTLREKMSFAVPEDLDPHGMARGWLGTAERNLNELLHAVVEHEL